MRNVVVFEHVSLDGFIADAQGDMRWAHKTDPETMAFAAENAAGGGMFLFGRITYAMMASFWPTPMAYETAPLVAKQMNELPKVVFSRTLEEASWKNTRLVKGGVAEEVRRLKSEPGPDMVVMGSGSIVSQLAEEGLVDRYELVINPIVLGKGKPLFEGVTRSRLLRLTKTRVFGNGNVFLSYAPAP